MSNALRCPQVISEIRGIMDASPRGDLLEKILRRLIGQVVELFILCEDMYSSGYKCVNSLQRMRSRKLHEAIEYFGVQVCGQSDVFSI